MNNSARRATAAIVLTATICCCGLLFAGCNRQPPRAEVLENSVNLENADVRREAFYQMGKWDVPEGEILNLVELTLLGETDPLVRAQVARTLGIWAAESSVDELATCLEKDPAQQVRAECARSLGEISTPEARAALITALREDRQSDVRVAAAQALRYHRNVEAGQALADVLGTQERDAAVRYYAADSLRYLTGQDFGYDAQGWSDFLAEAENPLAGYGKPPKHRKIAEPPATVNGEQSKTREILGDLFPLERKEGPFD